MMTRVLLLQRNGYEVVTANRFEEIEGSVHEGEFDLIVVETDDVKKASIAYGERLRGINPHLPILLLSDTGLFLPREVLLSRFAESPSPLEVLGRIAALLLESSHEREDPK